MQTNLLRPIPRALPVQGLLAHAYAVIRRPRIQPIHLAAVRLREAFHSFHALLVRAHGAADGLPQPAVALCYELAEQAGDALDSIVLLTRGLRPLVFEHTLQGIVLRA